MSHTVYLLLPTQKAFNNRKYWLVRPKKESDVRCHREQFPTY